MEAYLWPQYLNQLCDSALKIAKLDDDDDEELARPSGCSTTGCTVYSLLQPSAPSRGSTSVRESRHCKSFLDVCQLLNDFFAKPEVRAEYKISGATAVARLMEQRWSGHFSTPPCRRTSTPVNSPYSYCSLCAKQPRNPINFCLGKTFKNPKETFMSVRPSAQLIRQRSVMPFLGRRGGSCRGRGRSVASRQPWKNNQYDSKAPVTRGHPTHKRRPFQKQ